MDSLRGRLGIRRMDRVPNVQVREMCGVTKEVRERIDKSAFRWFGYIERMGKDRIVKMVCVGECMGSPLVCNRVGGGLSVKEV